MNNLLQDNHFYLFSGSDAGSSSGCWSVIVCADNRKKAIGILGERLKNIGRSDLLDHFNVKKIKGQSNSIMFSDIET